MISCEFVEWLGWYVFFGIWVSGLLMGVGITAEVFKRGDK